MKAGGSLNLTGTQVAIGTDGKGSGILAAGGAVNIAAVKNEVNTSVQNDASSKMHDKVVHRNETVLGAGVAAADDLTMRAGVGGSADLTVTGSVLAGGGNVALSATNNVNIVSTIESHLSTWQATANRAAPSRRAARRAPTTAPRPWPSAAASAATT